MSFAPRFSPDGTKVVMSISENGQSDIYEMDVRGRALRRLTNTPAIDTSPCYSNDGAQIVFNSDRGGSQQLYVMSAGGGGERRISFGEGRYATPVWSPRGDWIAFTKITAGSLRHRRHAARRRRRAHAGLGLPGRGPDLGAQRPRAGLLPSATELGGSRRLGHFAPD